MKKLAFACLALAVATLVACSDDSSSTTSTSKEKKVSCRERTLIDGAYENMLCFQTVESKREDVEDGCTEDEYSEYVEASLLEEPCDETRLKKKCPFPEDEDLVLFVYDKSLGRADCEEVWNILMSGDEADDETDDEGNIDFFSRDSNEVISLYVAPQKVCIEYKIFASLKSKLKYRYDDSTDLMVMGNVVYGSGCENVEEKPVVICSDDDSYDALNVYFYDESLKGKTCEEIDPFEPMEFVIE